MTLEQAVYYKLWASTANWSQRSNYGWYQVCYWGEVFCLLQVWSRLAPWGAYARA